MIFKCRSLGIPWMERKERDVKFHNQKITNLMMGKAEFLKNSWQRANQDFCF